MPAVLALGIARAGARGIHGCRRHRAAGRADGNAEAAGVMALRIASMFAAPRGIAAADIRLRVAACRSSSRRTVLGSPSCCREVTWKISPVSRSTDTPTSLNRRRCSSRNRAGCRYRRCHPFYRQTTPAERRRRSRSAAALGATPSGKQSWRVPSANRPRFVVGDVSTRSRTIGPFEVRYIADDLKRVEALRLEGMGTRRRSNISRILPPPPPASERTPLVVVGIESGADAMARPGAAASSRTISSASPILQRT